MKIHRLRMQNFRQHARSEIWFADGITAIIGPNGSGKTTILEAIAWALYGQSAARGDRDGIRFLGAGARAPVEVELEFELGGHRYRVTRGMTTAAVYLDGAAEPVANSITGTTELLQQRLGMTRAEFFNTYFTGQKELAVMTRMGRTERAQFLSRVLGYERLRSAQDLARERRREVGAQIAGLRQGLTDAESVERAVHDARGALAACVARSNEAGTRHAVALAALRRITPLWEEAQRARDAWQRRSAERVALESEITSLEREQDRMAMDIHALVALQPEVERLRAEIAPLASYRAELRHLADQLERQGRRQALIEAERALGAELAELRQRHARIERDRTVELELAARLERERRELDAVTAALDSARTDWTRDRQEAQTKLEELRRQYSDVKAQRERLVAVGPDGACPTCSRPLAASYASVVEQLREQLETLHVDGQYYRARSEQLSEPPPAVAELEARRSQLTPAARETERRLAQVQASVQQLAAITRDITQKEARRAQLAREVTELTGAYDPDRHGFLRAAVERMGALEVQLARLEGDVGRLPRLRTEQERIAVQLTARRGRLVELTGSDLTPPLADAEFESLRSEHADAAEHARETEIAVVAAQGDVRVAQSALDAAEDARREHARIADALAVLARDRALHEELDRAFAELRTDLNDALRPEISEIATGFLSSLTDGRYSEFELNDDYDVRLLEDGIVKPVISGGEEDLANLVLRLAISQMIADRSGQPFSLLILDEVFASLDAARRENVVALLRALQDRFEQVILITHIEAVREGVDHVVMVHYDEETGSSVVEGSDAPPVLTEMAGHPVLEPA